MRLAVVGATGKTGRKVVGLAMERGFEVVAIARGETAWDWDELPGLRVARADVRDAAEVTRAIEGCDAVISAVGVGTRRATTTTYSAGVESLVGAMRVHGLRDLAVVSANPVGDRSGRRVVERRVVLPILDRIFGASYEDMRRMEAILRTCALDWVCLRPPRLLDQPGRGSYRAAVGQTLPHARDLTHTDLAHALLDARTTPGWARQVVEVAR